MVRESLECVVSECILSMTVFAHIVRPKNRLLCFIGNFIGKQSSAKYNFDSDNWENRQKFNFKGNKMGKIGSLVAKKVLARRKDFYFLVLWCEAVII